MKQVLDYLSNKEWRLVDDAEIKIKELKLMAKNSTNMNLKRAVKNYTKYFKRPMYFEHKFGVYKTGRLFAQYVLFPNKKVGDIYLKELIIPEENYVFVSFDYKTSQMRHLAVFRELDEVKQIIEKEDIYERMSKESGLNNRDIAKTSMLILSYGGSLETIVEKYPDVELEKVTKLVKIYEKWFKTEGMTFEEKSKLAGTIQQIEMNFFKRKLKTLLNRSSDKWRLHAFIHDDIILEIHKSYLKEITEIKKYLEKNDKIKMEVEVKISDTFQFERS